MTLPKLLICLIFLASERESFATTWTSPIEIVVLPRKHADPLDITFKQISFHEIDMTTASIIIGKAIEQAKVANDFAFAWDYPNKAWGWSGKEHFAIVRELENPQVSLSQDNVTLRQVLDDLCRQSGWTYQKNSMGLGFNQPLAKGSVPPRVTVSLPPRPQNKILDQSISEVDVYRIPIDGLIVLISQGINGDSQNPVFQWTIIRAKGKDLQFPNFSIPVSYTDGPVTLRKSRTDLRDVLNEACAQSGWTYRIVNHTFEFHQPLDKNFEQKLKPIPSK